jgi:ABC-2 type transport system ATP-binding protein
VITALRERGAAVLLTSHYLEEVQRLADRVIVMRTGSIVANDAPDRIIGHSGQGVVISFRSNAATLPIGPWERVPSSYGTAELVTEDAVESMRVLLAWATNFNIELDDLEVRHRSLEERYLELTSDP